MVLCKIEKESDEWKYTTGVIRNYNLQTFLYTVLGNFKSATEASENALGIDGQNIVALSNKAWLLLRQKINWLEISKICNKVDALINDPFRVTVAKSEQSYAYGRLGMRHCHTAFKLIREVIEDAEKLISMEYNQPKEWKKPSVLEIWQGVVRE